ncbi:MAG: CHAT domain-containing protein [Bacteroidales bacterium]|nr:CHAT domain-containing protein [Bacteroidales bacterium]
MDDEEAKTKTDDLRSFVNRSRFKALPGTREEINAIAEILATKGIKSKMFTKDKATEQSFKTINNQKPEILHLATHGFYYSPELSFYITELYGFRENSNKITNPLLRSALLFAGANNIGIDKDGENGILSSYEISKLDLSGIDLVVLSACETGLGEIRGSEGVFGLQRAFIIAGVKKLIISLWKVPDKETSELMSAFYRYFIDEKHDAHEALKKAQLQMRLVYPNNPSFWGAFILVE